jgi:CTP:molybdopterin cytidylyltransferase MocA
MIASRRSGVRSTPQALAGWPGGLWIVVLAGGGSRRFGRSKLLRRIGGETLLKHAARQATRVAGSRCLVVLGANASRLAVELRGLPASAVVNHAWRKGMACSLQAGVGALPRSARAALVLLADQYAVDARDLRRLAAAWSERPAQAAAALVDARPGAPAILPRSLFPKILRLKGDEGARSLLRERGLPVTGVELAAAGRDLDDRRDLEELRGRRTSLPR